MTKAMTKVVGVVLALVIAVAGMGTAFAQEEVKEVQAEPLVKVLAVKAPNVVEVGDEVTIAVTERHSSTPFEGAYVYALSRPVPATAASVSAGVLDCPESYHCEFLGTSNAHGEVTHRFSNPGRLLISATKDGYGPGLCKLIVKPNVMKGMKIEAPARAEVEQPVDIKVIDRNDGTPVPEADIWAIGWPFRVSTDEGAPAIEDAKRMLEELKAGDSTVLHQLGAEYLGQTADDGVLIHAFGETGSYWLIATKSEYRPAMDRITIVHNNALRIRAPRVAQPGDDVVFQVLTRGLGDPVKDASLYAVKLPCEGLDSMTPPYTDADSSVLENLATDCGHYLGDTDENGTLTHAFEEEGRYCVLALKDGYVPAVHYMKVGNPVADPVVERASGATSITELMPFNGIIERFRGNPSGEVAPWRSNYGKLRIAPTPEPVDATQVSPRPVEENDEA